MKFKQIVQAAMLCGGWVCAGAANADSVTCGGLSGLRVTVVDPALVGGLCATGIGNLQNADIATLGLVEVEKDVAPAGTTTGQLTYTQVTGGRSGTWGVDGTLWNSWENLYIGFHFGGGGNNTPGPNEPGNPDWFVVQLARTNTGGTWDLNPDTQGSNGALSNIYLLRGTQAHVCTLNCGGGENSVPEPASLALVGLALAGVAGLRRKA